MTLAIILAAGIGKRLRPLTNNIPKILLDLDGNVLMDITICNLLNVGINNIMIVVGHASKRVIERANALRGRQPTLNFTFIENKFYDQTNTGFSLLLALNEIVRRDINDDLIVINGDVLFDIRILLKLVSACLLYTSPSPRDRG